MTKITVTIREGEREPVTIELDAQAARVAARGLFVAQREEMDKVSPEHPVGPNILVGLGELAKTLKDAGGLRPIPPSSNDPSVHP